MKVPSYSDIGQSAKELLYGGKTGSFQYDKTLTVNAKTQQGVSFALKAIEKDGEIKMPIKAVYKHGLFTAEFTPSNPMATVTVTKQVIDGLKMNVSGTVPDFSARTKATIEYAQPHLTAKGVCTLNNMKPTLDCSGVVGYNGFVVGGHFLGDTTSQKVKKWSAAASYSNAQLALTAHVAQGLDTVRLTYHQKLDPVSTIGAEGVISTNTSTPKLLIGYSHVNIMNGDLTKAKLGNDGVMHGLYEFKLRPDLTVATSMSLNALDASSAPKFGIAIDHSPLC